MNINDRSGLKVIALLLLLTISLTALQKYSLNRSLVIDGTSSYPIHAVYDQMSGGMTVGRLSREGSHLILECEIKDGYAWPYCEMNIDLRQTSNDGSISGVDLSRYERVGLWARHEDNQESGMRLHLRNFNENYSRHDKPESLKYNALEFHGFNSEYPLWVSLNSFQVTTWWLVENKITLKDIAPEFTNVLQLEIVTVTGVKPGKYRLVVERIEFQGKLISEKNTYLIIVLIWVFAAFAYIARWVFEFQREIHKNKSRQRELETINRVLNVKSQQLEDKASRDSLTGALNREGLQKLFYEGLAHAGKSRGLCIAFMDIDHFKKINDTFGHNVGDNILKEFTELVTKNTRTADVLARWGGEEFILACPDSSLGEASTLAEKLRIQIEKYVWPLGISMTCSFGIAKMTNETIEAFIHRADRALYDAKAQGRNKVVISEPLA